MATKITAARLNELKARVKAECLRRSYVGSASGSASVSDYGGTSYDYSVTPVSPISNPGPFTSTSGWYANQSVTLSVTSSALKCLSNQTSSTPGTYAVFGAVIPSGTEVTVIYSIKGNCNVSCGFYTGTTCIASGGYKSLPSSAYHTYTFTTTLTSASDRLYFLISSPTTSSYFQVEYVRVQYAGIKILSEHRTKLATPLRAINSSTISSSMSKITDADITAMEALVTTLEQQSKTNYSSTNCSGGCTGLCYGCMGTCYNACSGCGSGCASTCTGTCSATCADDCESTCTGDCTGDCTDSCSQACSSDCVDGCGGGCSGYCDDECTASCGASSSSTT